MTGLGLNGMSARLRQTGSAIEVIGLLVAIAGSGTQSVVSLSSSIAKRMLNTLASIHHVNWGDRFPAGGRDLF